MTKYAAFAADLWRVGTQATDTGATRVVTRKKLQRYMDKHDLTESQALYPDCDENVKVSVTPGGCITVTNRDKLNYYYERQDFFNSAGAHG